MSRNYCVGYFNTVSLILSVRPCASSPCVNGGKCKNLKNLSNVHVQLDTKEIDVKSKVRSNLVLLHSTMHYTLHILGAVPPTEKADRVG